MVAPGLLEFGSRDVIYGIIFLADLLLIGYMVFIQQRHPSYVIPWVIIIVFLPVVGFFLYLVFGLNYFKEKHFRLKSEEDRRLIQLFLAKHENEMERTGREGNGTALPLMRMLLRNDNAPVLRSPRVRVFNEGRDKFDALFKAIEGAEHHVHLEYYILRDDRLGNELVDLLTRKARQGVEVRLLLDGLGSKIPKKKYKAFDAAGGRRALLYKPLIPYLTLRFNYHAHRKIAVIDGRIGFVGGFNIGVEYLGEGPLGPWRDYAAGVEGEAVRALQIRFLLDWNYATKEGLSVVDEAFFPTLDGAGGVPVQVVSSGPDNPRMPIKDEYLKLVGMAQRYIYIQTPYFIPDESIMDALKIAALSGVDVRIMFPDKPDHPFVYWASLSFIGQLLPWGVRAYTFDGGFVHAKTAFVDDAISSIGSANWDIRSFRLNFETNVVIYDPSVTRLNRELFEKDLEGCTEITLEGYRKRGLLVRIKEGISRLITPVL